MCHPNISRLGRTPVAQTVHLGAPPRQLERRWSSTTPTRSAPAVILMLKSPGYDMQEQQISPIPPPRRQSLQWTARSCSCPFNDDLKTPTVRARATDSTDK